MGEDDHHLELAPTRMDDKEEGESSVELHHCQEQREDELPDKESCSHLRRRSKRKQALPASTIQAASDMIKQAEPIVKESVQQVKKKCRWGGNLIEEIRSHDGDVVAFTNHRLQVHGLKEAFDGTNGWSRTFFYLFIWASWGCFFLVLTVPLVRDYRARKVLTKFETFSGLALHGLPLPILTVCPHGSGLRCECLLWRKLHCRYEAMGEPNWMKRFDLFGCWPEFRRSNMTDMNYPFPVWDDPQCEDFENPNITLVDPCAASAIQPEKYNVDRLFEKVVERESSGDGPYLTYLERERYATVPLVEKVDFFRTTRNIYKRVSSQFVEPRYHEKVRHQTCIQLRIPPEEAEHKQKALGAENGIMVVAHDIDEEKYPLMDIYTAKRAVDIHVNLWEENLLDMPVVTERHQYFVAPAGRQTHVGYKHEHYIRCQGWGPIESQTCTKKAIPRGLCVQDIVLQTAAEACGCHRIELCSSTEGTLQNRCVSEHLQSLTGNDEASVDLPTCPIRCEYSHPVFTGISVADTTEAQILYFKNIVSQPVNYLINEDKPIPKYENATAGNTVLWSIGLSSSLVQTYEESPVTSLAGLMGTIGGNLGLWMGLSFSLFAEILEMLIVALMFGRPTEFVLSWLQERRRGMRGSQGPAGGGRV